MNLFITGISRGLGKEMVLYFTKKGHKVFGISINEPDYLKEINAEKTGFYIGSVTDDSDLKNAVEKGIEFLGKVDVLINNAALKLFKMPDEITEDEYKEAINTNLTSQILLCRRMIPHFLKNKSGKIINIASNAGMTSYKEGTAYCSSKAGLIAYSQSLAKYLNDKNISVNVVSPPTFSTEDYKNDYPNLDHSRLLQSDRVIKVIDYIISSDKFFTGKNFPMFKFKSLLKYTVLKNLELMGYLFQKK
ncbi:MAG: SDR family oxidoreductase [Ignavibacteriae bacterium]|nr:SDR family oxidoreductase [Ignavibacteriota bacterium]